MTGSRNLRKFGSLAGLGAALLAVAGCRCASEPKPSEPAALNRPFVTTAACPLPKAIADATEEELDGRFDEAVAKFQAAFDGGRFDEALACAQEAARLGPDSPGAHVDRGIALEALGQFEDAHLAFERAVALDPNEPETLRALADFLIKDGAHDALETALIYARRGREYADGAQAAAELAAMEATAANALGRPAEGLRAAESALALDAEQSDAVLERGVALFELLDFPAAQSALADARRRSPDNAKAAHFAALCAERLGSEAEATTLFQEATRIDPTGFPPALEVDGGAFQTLFDEAIRGLAQPERARLGGARVGWEELPSLADLKAGDPVLSPTIIGLYRPGEAGGQDAILLYRRNLLRLSRTPDELRREVRDTLLHEVGHLDGANDEELRDRGL